MSFKECRAVPKKVPEKRRKRKAPSTKTRGSISKTEYNRMIEAFGCHCVYAAIHESRLTMSVSAPKAAGGSGETLLPYAADAIRPYTKTERWRKG